MVRWQRRCVRFFDYLRGQFGSTRQFGAGFGTHAALWGDLPCGGDSSLLMQAALETARSAPIYGDVPIGAVLWSGGRILARAFNSREHARTTLGHAEMELIHSYNRATGSWRLPADAVIAVTAEPCLMCTGALLQARAARVVYGCKDTKNAGLRLVEDKIISGAFDHRFEIVSAVLEKECAQLLSEFFQKRRQEKKSADNE